jgi:hypothetical protein
MSIAIIAKARKANEGLINLAMEKLINGFMDKLLYYFVNYNIRVTQFVAVVWTDQGKRLCELLGMKIIGHDEYQHPVYSIDLDPEELLKTTIIFESVRKLALTYRNFPKSEYAYK